MNNRIYFYLVNTILYAIELAIILIIAGLFFLPPSDVEPFLIITLIFPLVWPVSVIYLLAYPLFQWILIPFIILNFFIAWYFVDKKLALPEIAIQNT